MQGQRFPSPGRCIYCGSDGGADGLRDEHIMPISLGGTAVIEDASCVECEKITSYIYRFLANKIFGEMRAHGAVRRRRRRRNKQRESDLPPQLIFDGYAQPIDLPLKDRPHQTILPVWEWPGITQGMNPSRNYGQIKAVLYWDIPTTFAAAAGMGPNDQREVRFRWDKQLNVDTFARAIAKIGYCHTVVRYGLDGFRRLVLPQIILGTYPCIPYFVGSDVGDPDPPDHDKALHKITYEEFRRDNMTLLLVSIRLFANARSPTGGMPIYHVITGARLLKR
jgi:hypothetical protein